MTFLMQRTVAFLKPMIEVFLSDSAFVVDPFGVESGYRLGGGDAPGLIVFLRRTSDRNRRAMNADRGMKANFPAIE